MNKLTTECPFLKEVVMMYCDACAMKKLLPRDHLVSASPCSPTISPGARSSRTPWAAPTRTRLGRSPMRGLERGRDFDDVRHRVVLDRTRRRGGVRVGLASRGRTRRAKGVRTP